MGVAGLIAQLMRLAKLLCFVRVYVCMSEESCGPGVLLWSVGKVFSNAYICKLQMPSVAVSWHVPGGRYQDATMPRCCHVHIAATLWMAVRQGT